MRRRPFLLRPKHELYRLHHERLSTRPDPERASEKFKERLAFMRRIHATRIASYVGLYFATAATVATFLLRFIDDPLGVGPLLDVVSGVASSMTALFFLGVLLTSRVLAWIEVELQFYSQESRMGPYTPPPAS